MPELVQQVPFGSTGMKVSPIIVGCMSYGSKSWQPWVEDNKEKVFALLKHCYDVGLRTFDTADVYNNGQSEVLLGEFLKKYNIRRETVVILTKIYFDSDDSMEVGSNFASINESTKLDLVNQRGLSRKHIIQGVKNSVRRLGTYIDVLQIHRLDDNVPMKSIMKSLNDVVLSGDVRYIGASSMLATEFADLQAIADKHDWFQFVNWQSQYNLLYREDEREVIPYAKRHNIAVTPWSPNARGLLAKPANVTSERKNFDPRLASISDDDKEIIGRVEKIAKDKDISMAMVSTAWVLSKRFLPIVGMSKMERIDEAVKAIKVTLTQEEIKYLEEAYKPKPLETLVKLRD
ncbi:hypothetical protein NCAS_0J01740 [Naumovozyma castellii]|uniref:NADP-dependent oxidoreductase domain-containing protein n=1 Tax=Naumovozyma castellii TaxID=27288 RepID=G0VKW5_NAUCA|nr:hypothetical protein NCAS_0J01740 [Naumovozyma castellii CBS 4309]CCC72153.1 hypothetical protein NCAS_0J01740 [Naumovozyma castellii CBS 4309]